MFAVYFYPSLLDDFDVRGEGNLRKYALVRSKQCFKYRVV